MDVSSEGTKPIGFFICQLPSKSQILRGSAVLLGLIASCALSAFTDFQNLYHPEFQPADIAFSIWGFIYFGILVMIVRLFRMDSYPRIDIIIAFLTTGLVASGFWGILASGFPVLQSPILYFCWINAVISSSLVKANLRTLDGWLMTFGPALFAGWLSLAAGLGLAIAGHAKGVHIGPWALLPTGIIAAIASIYSGTPGTSIPLLWAVIWSDWSLWSTPVVLVVGILSLFGSLARGFGYTKPSDFTSSQSDSSVPLQKFF